MHIVRETLESATFTIIWASQMFMNFTVGAWPFYHILNYTQGVLLVGQQ